MTLYEIAILLAALGSALIGGLFFAFSTFIMRALAARPAGEGMAAMVAINRAILRSLFMPVFFGTALLAGLAGGWAVTHWGPEGWYVSLGALSYLAGSIIVTMAWNVPLNNLIERAPAGDNDALWALYLRRWTRWNHVRTLASLAAAALFILGLSL
ncbi:MAG TPA: anthrone oxygenase family protein [Allosphingosinicella sp.]|nr:anthrone oxygenase family protein [Allosphingosinicella sp.]